MKLSTSQQALRAIIALVSVALVVLTWTTSPMSSLAAAFVVLLFTPFAVLDPGSRLTALVLALHGGHWLMSNRAPASTRDWALVGIVAVGILTMHLCAALAASLPPAAPVPAASSRRWGVRGLAVVGLSVPVWALLVLESRTLPAGDSLATYVALSAVALLGLAIWLTLRSEAPVVPDPDEEE